MKTWKTVFTERAERDLREIFEYIAFSLLEPEIGRKQTKRIIDGIEKLNQMPERHHVYDKEPWNSRGLRVLPIDNYSVFYLLVEGKNMVAIVRIMYSGRNIDEQLKQSDIGE